MNRYDGSSIPMLVMCGLAAAYYLSLGADRGVGYFANWETKDLLYSLGDFCNAAFCSYAGLRVWSESRLR